MEITTLQVVLILVVACIAGIGSILDEFQFHRPLVACTLIGFILGDVKTGVIIGGTLEMIALGWMNIGAAVAPDAALASIISTILVIAGGQDVGAGIALALIDTDSGVTDGDTVSVDVRGRGLECEVIKPPFVQVKTR